jgi:hypothetical protein
MLFGRATVTPTARGATSVFCTWILLGHLVANTSAAISAQASKQTLAWDFVTASHNIHPRASAINRACAYQCMQSRLPVCMHSMHVSVQQLFIIAIPLLQQRSMLLTFLCHHHLYLSGPSGAVVLSTGNALMTTTNSNAYEAYLDDSALVAAPTNMSLDDPHLRTACIAAGEPQDNDSLPDEWLPCDASIHCSAVWALHRGALLFQLAAARLQLCVVQLWDCS